MTEFEKMLAEELYVPADSELEELRHKAHQLSQLYNQLDESDTGRAEVLGKLLRDMGDGSYFQGPIQFDYGINTSVGKNFFANFNLTILDCAEVTIGDDVMVGPNVSLLTPLHPLRFQDRNVRVNTDGHMVNYEYAAPITINDNCWISGDVKILGGVTIGAGSVIGAESVVTRDIPENVIAVGNPCRIVREITEADRMKLPE